MTLGLVTSPSELLKVARFRYAVYVEEMGRPQPSADHRNRLIVDRMDIGSHIIAAWSGDEVVGTVRVSLCGTSDVGKYRDWYRAEEVAGHHWPNRTAILTRLMVGAGFRRTTINARLCLMSFQVGVAHGVACALLDCNDHLVDYFGRLGFRAEGTFEHPDYGTVRTLSLDLLDWNRLTEIRSPFLRTRGPDAAALLALLRDAEPVSEALIAGLRGELGGRRTPPSARSVSSLRASRNRANFPSVRVA